MNKRCSERALGPPQCPPPSIKEIWVSAWLLPFSAHLLPLQTSPSLGWVCTPARPNLSPLLLRPPSETSSSVVPAIHPHPNLPL